MVSCRKPNTRIIQNLVRFLLFHFFLFFSFLFIILIPPWWDLVFYSPSELARKIWEQPEKSGKIHRAVLLYYLMSASGLSQRRSIEPERYRISSLSRSDFKRVNKIKCWQCYFGVIALPISVASVRAWPVAPFSTKSANIRTETNIKVMIETSLCNINNNNNNNKTSLEKTGFHSSGHIVVVDPHTHKRETFDTNRSRFT